MSTQSVLTSKRLKSILHYDSLTGLFTWKVSPTLSVNVGDIAGNSDTGNMRIGVDGCSYLAHRLAWFYVKNVYPKNVIDHEDGNSLNNAFSNLRDVTQSINMRNAAKRKDNTSNVTGVHFHNGLGKWRAVIGVDGNPVKHLGVFFDKFEAICARKSAEVLNGYHVNHGREASCL